MLKMYINVFHPAQNISSRLIILDPFSSVHMISLRLRVLFVLPFVKKRDKQ